MQRTAVLEAWDPPVDPSAGRTYSPRQLEILDAIEVLLLEEGFRDLTVGALAARLRCSRRTLYELAPSKDELVVLVLDRLLRRMGHKAHARVRALADPVDRIEALLLTALRELRDASVAFAEDVAAHPGVRTLFEGHYRYAMGRLQRLVDEAMQAGALRDSDPRLVAEVMDAALARVQDPAVMRAYGLNVVAASEAVVRLLLDGVRAR